MAMYSLSQKNCKLTVKKGIYAKEVFANHFWRCYKIKNLYYSSSFVAHRMTIQVNTNTL
ncbi:hypothetical protein M2474_001213 [Dysgonomonas sp. PH5-37]|nr:hypothetical protein [Dysgonomonas sp. PH5-37]